MGPRRELCAAIFFGIAAALPGAAAQAQPVSGREYQELSPHRPVSTGERVEVIEFFDYGCPVCYEAQPCIARWLTRAGPGVALLRVPAVFTESSESFARTFYALGAMNEIARLHWPLYDNHHFDGKQLNEEKNITAWVAANGVERARFRAVEVDAVTAQIDVGEEGARQLRRQGRAELRGRRQVPHLGEDGGQHGDMVRGRLSRRARRQSGRSNAHRHLRRVLRDRRGAGALLRSSGNRIGLISRRRSTAPRKTCPIRSTSRTAASRGGEGLHARFGAPDLVIANAGISIGTSGEELDDVAKLRRVLDVNVVGLAATLAAFAPAMRKAGRGTLAGIASVAGFRGLAGATAPTAPRRPRRSPGWRACAPRLHGSGVSVVCICPGYIDTPMTQVNRYRMPFIMSADDGGAPHRARHRREPRRLAVIPWQMALVSVALRTMLPGWLYDRLAAARAAQA